MIPLNILKLLNKSSADTERSPTQIFFSLHFSSITTVAHGYGQRMGLCPDTGLQPGLQLMGAVN